MPFNRYSQHTLLFLCFLFFPLFAEAAPIEPLSIQSEPLPVIDKSKFEIALPEGRLSFRAEGVFDSVAIKGIDIYLISRSTGDTLGGESDRRGMMKLDSLEGGIWDVEVTDEQYELSSARVITAPNGDRLVQLQLQKQISILWMVLTVMGGLGVFLLGMESMSHGLQTVAGSGLRRLVAALTSNRLFALLVGVGVTSVVQSSSITTVMVVGFVNSGIMHLREAIGVIMGANIGTTVTAWILVLAVDKWGLPILGVAAFVHLFSKREKVKFSALTVMGIGMVFFGLELMKNGLEVMRESPAFLEWFSMFRADHYAGVLKVTAIGCILTMIVQSSSATMGIVIALASQGIISFDTSIALVMGSNVGTTITAQLASLGANVEARRCAWFHTLFNFSGVLLISAVFPIFMKIVLKVTEIIGNPEFVAEGGERTLAAASVPLGIAVVSTLFNAVMTVIYFPILHKMAIFLEKVIPDRKGSVALGGVALSALEGKHYDNPLTALAISRHEIRRMGQRNVEMSDSLEAYLAGTDREQNREFIFQSEAELDTQLREVGKFVAEVMNAPLSIQDAEEVKVQLRVGEEHESVSDYITQILKLHLRLEAAGISFTPEQQKEISGLHGLVSHLLKETSPIANPLQAQRYLPTMEVKGKEITVRVRQLRDIHWKRLAQNELNPLVSTVYGDLIVAYRKIRNHLFQLVETWAGL